MRRATQQPDQFRPSAHQMMCPACGHLLKGKMKVAPRCYSCGAAYYEDVSYDEPAPGNRNSGVKR